MNKNKKVDIFSRHNIDNGRRNGRRIRSEADGAADALESVRFVAASRPEAETFR